jgi:hypothetical protein
MSKLSNTNIIVGEVANEDLQFCEKILSYESPREPSMEQRAKFRSSRELQVAIGLEHEALKLSYI